MRTLLEDLTDFMLIYPGLSASAIGYAAVRDKYFVPSLAKGRSPRELTVAKVRAWMAAFHLAQQGQAAAIAAARARIDTMVTLVNSREPDPQAEPEDQALALPALPPAAGAEGAPAPEAAAAA